MLHSAVAAIRGCFRKLFMALAVATTLVVAGYNQQVGWAQGQTMVQGTVG